MAVRRTSAADAVEDLDLGEGSFFARAGKSAPAPNNIAAVDELLGTSPPALVPATEPEPPVDEPPEPEAPAPEPEEESPRPRPVPPLVSTSQSRRRRPASQDTVRVDLPLPEDIVSRARSLGRPSRTGAERSLGARFVLRAYVQAVHDLVPEIDLHGVDADNPDEAVRRVTDALRQA